MGEFFQEPEFGKRFGKIGRELTEREERLIRQKVPDNFNKLLTFVVIFQNMLFFLFSSFFLYFDAKEGKIR